MKFLILISLVLSASACFGGDLRPLDQSVNCRVYGHYASQEKGDVSQWIEKDVTLNLYEIAKELENDGKSGGGGFPWTVVKLNDEFYVELSGEPGYISKKEKEPAYVRAALVQVKDGVATGVDFKFLYSNDPNGAVEEFSNMNHFTPSVDLAGVQKFKYTPEQEKERFKVTVNCSEFFLNKKKK